MKPFLNDPPASAYSPWRMSVAPMMDWSDRHCRYFHRLLTRHALLYTEMVNAGAVLYGGTERHLRFNVEEHPVALQLGGCDPTHLAKAAKLGEAWGYQEINLNCGCPSERVQRGAFGASLMKEPSLVADCVKAMRDAVQVPVTVKHRIGIGRDESYGFMRDFVGEVAQAGCTVFVVHARNAWLEGLSPKQNREVPPLRYDVVHQLKQEFPALTIAINGGFKSNSAISQQLQALDGVMVGREAYQNPWWLTEWDTAHFAAAPSALTRDDAEAAMVDYMERESEHHQTPWPSIARHILGLRHGERGARLWRQVWSDHRLKELPAREVAARAQHALRTGAALPSEPEAVHASPAA